MHRADKAQFIRAFDMEVLRPEQPWIDQNSGVSLHREFNVCLRTRKDIRETSVWSNGG